MTTATDSYGDTIRLNGRYTARLEIHTSNDGEAGPAGGYYVFTPEERAGVEQLRDALDRWLAELDRPGPLGDGGH
jgi:hypothetical protein